jgi:hypothetical protein
MVLAADSLVSTVNSSDTSSLQLLLELLKWSLIAAASLALLMVMSNFSKHGSVSPFKALWIWFSASISFIAIFMPVSIFIVFGKALSSSLPGLSILLGMSGMMTVGIERIHSMWEKRNERLEG